MLRYRSATIAIACRLGFKYKYKDFLGIVTEFEKIGLSNSEDLYRRLLKSKKANKIHIGNTIFPFDPTQMEATFKNMKRVAKTNNLVVSASFHNHPIAIKHIEILESASPKETERRYELFQRELDIFGKISHRNIAKFTGMALMSKSFDKNCSYLWN